MKKKLVAALLSIAMVASMAACGGGEAKEAEKPAEETSKEAGDEKGEEKGTVEFWTCWTEGADACNASLEMFEKFEEETGYKVNHTNFTYDMLHEKVLTAAAGGNVPDLVWGLPEYVGEFYNMGIVEDLTEKVNAWDDKGSFDDAVWKAMTIDNKIVGVPHEMTVRAYLSHANDMEAAGIEVPETWEELLAQTDYKEKNGKYLTELACTGVRSVQELLVYLAQYDLEIASAQDDGKFKNTWNENPEQLEKAAKVFQFYQDLSDKGIVDPNCKTWGWEETDENLATGLVSTYVTGNWLQGREETNPDTMADITVHPIPYPSDGHPATYLEAKPLFVMADSKNKDGAWELATWYAGKELQENGFRSRSARKDVVEDNKWSKDFQALSDTGITFPPVTLGGITQAMQDSIAKVLQEGKTPEEAASWLCDAVNASLSDSGELSE